MAKMMDLDKDREVVKRTIKEKGPLTKAIESFKDSKASMSRQQASEGAIRRNAGMGSSKNVDAGSGRGTTTFGKDKTFSQAFREARDAGKDTFTWNGKKYTTEMDGEKKPSSDVKFESSVPEMSDYDEGRTTTFKRGGSVKSSASKRADGCCIKGKTRGKMV